MLIDGKASFKKPPFDYHTTIKSLNNKNIYITKSDKGNGIVILDKSEYDNRMLKLNKDGPYEEYR